MHIIQQAQGSVQRIAACCLDCQRQLLPQAASVLLHVQRNEVVQLCSPPLARAHIIKGAVPRELGPALEGALDGLGASLDRQPPHKGLPAVAEREHCALPQHHVHAHALEATSQVPNGNNELALAPLDLAQQGGHQHSILFQAGRGVAIHGARGEAGEGGEGRQARGISPRGGAIQGS
jgi:hypothetical protein